MSSPPSDTTSQPPLPDSALAALDDASRAVTDAVRASFIPSENVDVDPATATVVANVALPRVQSSLRRPLHCCRRVHHAHVIRLLRRLIWLYNSVTLHFVPLLCSIYLDVVTLHFGVHLDVVDYRHHVAADHDLASSVPGDIVCRRPGPAACGYYN
uniref:Uncharacterized protein n=1 Tax=Oryza meridionalis TaxID=40149 RepID=A0A0E0C7B2_9ORYZ